MGAFAPSLLEWVGSSEAMALRTLPSEPLRYVPPFAMRARVGSGYPSLPLDGATYWLGILFMMLRSVKEDIPACNERETTNMKKRRV